MRTCRRKGPHLSRLPSCFGRESLFNADFTRAKGVDAHFWCLEGKAGVSVFSRRDRRSMCHAHAKTGSWLPRVCACQPRPPRCSVDHLYWRRPPRSLYRIWNRVRQKGPLHGTTRPKLEKLPIVIWVPEGNIDQPPHVAQMWAKFGAFPLKVRVSPKSVTEQLDFVGDSLSRPGRNLNPSGAEKGASYICSFCVLLVFLQTWMWVKTNGIPFWSRCSTHFSLF